MMPAVREYLHRNRATLLFLSTCAWLTVPYLLHSSFTSLAMSSSQFVSVSLQTQDIQESAASRYRCTTQLWKDLRAGNLQLE